MPAEPTNSTPEESTESTPRTFADVAYGNKTRNHLDLYLPADVEKPPLVVFIHGGSWFRNDKTQVRLYDRVDALLEAGIAIASMDYTYSTEETWPSQLDDVRNAFEFLRSQADSYGYDATRIAVWGQSSGAHLALWAAFDQASDPDTRLDALISWYAPSDLYNIAPDRKADDVPDNSRFDREPSPETLLVGKPVPEHKELADSASPAVYLQTLAPGVPLPATLLMHGTQDATISPLQSERLFQRMNARGGAAPLELRYVEGGGHGGKLFHDAVPGVIEFLRKALSAD
jgi:acetyl esterase/lipase